MNTVKPLSDLRTVPDRKTGTRREKNDETNHEEANEMDMRKARRKKKHHKENKVKSSQESHNGQEVEVAEAKMEEENEDMEIVRIEEPPGLQKKRKIESIIKFLLNTVYAFFATLLLYLMAVLCLICLLGRKGLIKVMLVIHKGDPTVEDEFVCHLGALTMGTYSQALCFSNTDLNTPI